MRHESICYDIVLRLGIHTSTSGSLEGAALTAAELGANTLQIFSASPRMWRARVPDPEQVRRMRAARERFDLNPLVVHANYLINLASQDPPIRAKSIDGFRGEIERAAAIGAEYLVVHPGSCRGQSVEAGIAAVALGLRDAAAGLRTMQVTVLLEHTAGSGAALGSRFEELQSIRELARDLTNLPVGYCFDTCHLLAAGFDIASSIGLRETIRHAELTLGLENVRVIHANDSKTPLGSRVDRHANIGEGHIGREAFRRILTQPKLRTKPFILETPIDEPGDDRRNLDTLKGLAERNRTTARRV
ncbi:MAG: deoxyribonuclease IV [Bryobacteraceae bacterium]